MNLREFASSLAGTRARVADEINAIGAKGALNIKEAMRDDAKASRYFRIVRHISYDQTKNGPRVFEWEIGVQGEGAGNLAGIAYFGGARGGGGTIRDPQAALNEEEPRFVESLSKLLERLP